MLIFKLLFILGISGAIILLIARLITAIHSKGRVYSVEDIPAERAAIVFGAGLWRDGSPTPVLRDRVQAASELYFQGKVEKLLLSGDNRFADYDEPSAMKNYALGLGVPEEVIILDFAGRRTYDTCYRAKEIFGLESAILVTQEFHLSRALYICDALGISSKGINADRRTYRKFSRGYWNLRESLATISALWDVHVIHPIPVLGDFEPIFPEE
ncbi:MAG: YdcF family protein [Anaerolineales bacterium]|uniref:YdcF family protein n=1 Tax=Candidatus Desulfolinea nitratireducens TaxID=2841698 RepID=A0A8J6TEA9_9CHLR|nr:YdcF family protein [Candidatus Desulfolinea nitratireducens]MBL6961418.1 YdcF family protein [Anaerolineales bacterium]